MSGTVRQPRLRMLANGTLVKGAFLAETTNTNTNHADSFHAQVALGSDPDLTAAWWSSQSDIQVEIDFSLDGGASWPLVFVGIVDRMVLDLPSGTVSLDGRDLSALLMEAKTHETFANQKSSEIAGVLAARHGLTVNADATTGIVGRFYQLEHDKLTASTFHKQTTEWDLLVWLAQQEGYAPPYVIANTLYFKADTLAISALPIVYVPRGAQAFPVLNGATDMACDRSLTLAKDIQVQVVTWNSKQKAPHASIYKAQGAKSPGSTKNPTQQYVIYAPPNASPTDIDRMAQAKLKELSMLERLVSFEMPGDLVMDQRSHIVLSGTGTSFDQDYFVDEVHRSMNVQDGFKQHVRCKNTSPRSQVSVF